MKKIILLVLLICISLSVLALNENFSDLKSLMNSYFNENGSLNAKGQTQIQYANAFSSQIPEPIRIVFGNETINIQITFADGKKQTIGIITKNAQIAQAQNKPYANPTITIFVSEASVKKILSQENRINAFVKAYNAGEIKYETTSFIPSITKSIIDSFLSFLKFFSFSK
ncbi:MAG: hypothetical protein Q7S21_04540 [archaeon]|nr:hypothetical protein [archaeon]